MREKNNFLLEENPMVKPGIELRTAWLVGNDVTPELNFREFIEYIFSC